MNHRHALRRTLAELRLLSREIRPRVQLLGRIKTVASIADKMSVKRLGVHQVLDVIGARLVTERRLDCYQLVRLIHRRFHVLEAEYDDYVSTPKPNGYQSIHTTVIGPDGLPVEIQVRTHWMDTLSKQGFAAHARYKQNLAAARSTDPRDRCPSIEGLGSTLVRTRWQLVAEIANLRRRLGGASRR